MGTHEKVDIENLTAGYEFPPAGFQLDSETMKKYLDAVEDKNDIYEQLHAVPPLAISALAMSAMFTAMTLPAGTIHVSQNLDFITLAKPGEKLTSYAKVNRNVERGKLHMLTIGIKVLNQNKTTVLTGETSFILPQAAKD